MTNSCARCGAINAGNLTRCWVCATRIDGAQQPGAAAGTTAQPEPAASVAPAVPPPPPPPPPPVVQPPAPLWTPTHWAPAQGMSTWADHHPASAQMAPLGAHLEVQLVARHGDWAQIVCSNGWSAWVDGRLLVSRG